jgi:GrpB-like predicted nucleotidyltransferase (UPF0157 family)
MVDDRTDPGGCSPPQAPVTLRGFIPKAQGLGFRWHSDNPDRIQRFFREPLGTRRTHLHVRPVGSFDEPLNLLFRDYLRHDSLAAREYAETKRSLAVTFHQDREGYVRANEPTVWRLLRQAHDWAQSSRWTPGPTDA